MSKCENTCTKIICIIDVILIPFQDPDKLGPTGSKNARNVETQEERQWKQMQALRQQQQQQGVLPISDQHVKEGVMAASTMGMAGAAPGMQFTPSSGTQMGVGGQRMMPPGSPGVAPGGMEGVRQPLQVWNSS